MRLGSRVAAGLAMGLLLWTGAVLAQGKPDCDAQGKMKTPEKVEGQVVKVDQAKGKVTVREPGGTVHEFQASAETLKDLKVGERIEAKLREAPKCP
jgi:aconitase B